MPISLFGSNYKAPDTFAYTGNPDLSWMPMDLFTQKTGSNDTNDYWNTRDKLVAQRIKDISRIKDNWDSNFNFVLDNAENNIYNNRNAWEKLFNIYNRGGSILAFDTETIGDFAGNLLSNDEAERRAVENIGITEIGFAIEKQGGIYQATGMTNPPGSFFFGIDSEQKKWLEDVLQKKINGQKLTDAEKSAMERASRHSTLGENAFSTFEAEWKGQKFTFVKQLGESKENSIKDIQSGIEAMAARYNPNREEQMTEVLRYINSFAQNNDNRAIIGQNLAFDVNVVNRYAAKHDMPYTNSTGLHKWSGFSKSFEYADSMQALRAYAKNNNTTVGEFIKSINPSITNQRLGSLEALIEAITSSAGYTLNKAHNAFEDAIATLKVFGHNNLNDDKNFLNIVRKGYDIANNLKTAPHITNLENSYVKINARGNIRSQDILTIKDSAGVQQYTTGYQVSNQFWEFVGTGNTDYTGIDFEINGTKNTVIDSSNKYVAYFKSADGVADLYKAFDSEDEFQSFLKNYTTLVNKNEANVNLQAYMHDRDIARRVIDGFFDVGQVTEHKGSNGGFASFQNYYNMYKDLSSLSEDAIKSMQLRDTNNNIISTTRDLISNIAQNDNIVNIIDYADKNNINSITSHFRNTIASQKMSAEHAAIRRYKERDIMSEVFTMFYNNENFFETANTKVSKIKDNLTRTIAFDKIKDIYLNSGVELEPREPVFTDQIYTIEDLNSVAIKNSKGNYTRVDVDNIDRGTKQLLKAFNKDSAGDIQTADRLLGVAEDLKRNKLLTDDQLKIIRQTHGASAQPFGVAQSIVTGLNKTTESIRGDIYKANDVVKALKSGETIKNITDATGYTREQIELFKNKDNRTLLESSISEISRAQSMNALSLDVKNAIDNEIEFLKGNKLITGDFDNKNFDPIRNILSTMHYDDESIDRFKSIYYQNGKGKANIQEFNRNLTEGDEIKALFFKSQKEDGSAFAVFTNNKNYAKVERALAGLNENATNRQVKDAISDMAAYFEIPYLEVMDLGENDIIRQMSGGKLENGKWVGGHGARSVFVRQGDNFARYDTFSLNIYEKEGKLTGYIKDQGGSYLTSGMQRAKSAYEAISVGDFKRAIRYLNNPNIARMSEEAAPQMNGNMDIYGNFVRSHVASVKDIEYAHTIALDPGEGNVSLLELLKDFTKQHVYDKVPANTPTQQAENAIRGIFKAFGKEYDLLLGDEKNLYKNLNIHNVYDSEPFKHFFQRYLTDQTGGIGDDKNIIGKIISGAADYGLENVEKEAITALKDKSILQIMAIAAKDNDYVTEDLYNTLNFLANNVQLDAAVGESYAHKLNMYFGGFNPQMMNNSGSSSIIRPTYTQRSNYRSYRLDENYFHDWKGLEKSLGIKFGDVYTSKQYIDFISKEDEAMLGKSAISEATVSRRNIIGAVQSISDTEIQSSKTQAMKYIKENANGLNIDALEKMYDRMIKDINTYEGKAYMRPSLGNQTFFALGDPKTMKSSQVHAIFEMGTEEEKEATGTILKELVGKKVENGTVIGKKFNKEGRLTNIVYNGQTIHEFTSQNAIELMETGKTLATVERQLEGFKVMFAEEKATAETLAYYTSIDPVQRAREVQDTLDSFGLIGQKHGDIVNPNYKYSRKEIETITNNMLKDIELLNKYSDVVYNAIVPNESGYKTVLIGNNNVLKHLSDVSIESKWNIIATSYNDEEGRNILRGMAQGITFEDGSTLASHMNNLNSVEYYNTLTFDNPSQNGSTNVLDKLIDRMRTENDKYSKRAIETMDYFEKNNIALLPIQRQQMNTFQGQAFKIDQRVYQAIATQTDVSGSTANSEKLAEYIRKSIESGYYDDNIVSVGVGSKYDTANRLWAKSIKERRGILSPKFEQEMFLGTLDAIDFVNGKLDVDSRNMIKVNATDLLSRIPKNSGVDAYTNYIFKTDGKNTAYIESLAKLGSNTTNLEFGSNSFYLDLSDYGKFNFNGQKDLTGIVLPFQQINTADEEIYVAESTKDTIRFFRKLQNMDKTSNNSEAIENALDDLFRAYGKEVSTGNKDSLVTKAFLKMNMPSSHGALAKDAIVPTINLDESDLRDIFDNFKELEYETAKSVDNTKELENNFKKLAEANKLLNEKIEDQRKAIREEKVNVVNKLNIKNERYNQYLRSFDDSLNLRGDVIESAIVTSKQMFIDSEMDTSFIGYKITQDYFSGTIGGLKKYDDISRFHYEIDEAGHYILDSNFKKQIKYEASRFTITNDEIFDLLNKMNRTFENTEYEDWSKKITEQIREDILKKRRKYDSTYEQAQAVFNALDDEAMNYINGNRISVGAGLGNKYLDRSFTEDEKNRFLSKYFKIYEDTGDRYASEVGILGFTNRYPNFSEAGMLPVRIYLNNTLNGSEVRFLGPQFSILQNLDFDGDTEFIKFLGNGGLLAKNNAEAILMKKQFENMNRYNVGIFSDSLKDSIKSYKYGSEAYFKAQILKDLSNDEYKKAKENFLAAITEDARKQISDEKNKDISEYIIAHSKPIKEAYRKFDEVMGKSVSNKEIIKAAIQARIGKEYIGNFSKPNLEIRNALTYMTSLAEGEELDKLRRIRENLFTIAGIDKNGEFIKKINEAGEEEFVKIEPTGILTLLEQKGIDTKHIKDAETLNNSTAWRVGVTRLFENANGSAKRSEEDILKSMESLVEGSRKVFFSESEQDNLEIAKEILSKPFKYWNGLADTDDITLGKKYLSALYEMSQMENAYQGFNGLLRQVNLKKAIANLQYMDSDEDIKNLVNLFKNSHTIDAPIADVLASVANPNKNSEFFRTDEKFNIFGRAVRENDIFVYEGTNGPVGVLYKGTTNKKINAYEIDLLTGVVEEQKIKDFTGSNSFAITIKDLNEKIKKYKGGRLLDAVDPNTPEHNLSLNNFTESGIKDVQRYISSLSINNDLQWFFDNTDDSDFNKLFSSVIKKQQLTPNYYDPNITLGQVFSEIAGDDADTFKNRISELKERIDYGIKNKSLTGSDDAKELIRSINREIANNPRENINRLSGNDIETLVTNYTQGFATIQNKEFIKRDLSEIKLSNQISDEINAAISTRDTNLNKIAATFYDDVVNKSISEESAFKSATESLQKEVNDSYNKILESLNKSQNAKEEMIYRFGWDKFVTNDNFIINLNNAKIEKRIKDNLRTGLELDAKVGYGQFTGLRISDLTNTQVDTLRRELEDAIPNLQRDSLEGIAALNTKEILSYIKNPGSSSISLNFTDANTLRDSYRILFDPETGEKYAKEIADEAKEAAMKAAREAAKDTEKKTLLSEAGKALKEMPSETVRYLKVGAAITGGIAGLGLVGHALFNNDTSDNNVEVPVSLEDDLKPQTVKIQNKNNLGYANQPTQASAVKKQHKNKVAPPSKLKSKTIYHDAGSGFNFKVSAQSYDKLQAESYNRMLRQSGLNNNRLNISRDNSKITDNWLENKFSQLME